MSKTTDIRVVGARLYFIPIQMRIPLKFGTETVTAVTCARACARVSDAVGRTAEGWGETPLSVQWVWPSKTEYEVRHRALKNCCVKLAEAWTKFGGFGHALEIGHDFQEKVLPVCLQELNRAANRAGEAIPWLAALLCCSVFDQAVHDAYGNLHQRPVYDTYGPEFASLDLSRFLQPADDAAVSFKGKFIQDFLLPKRMDRLRAWHLVGGVDLLDQSELTGSEPNDGYPVLLSDWVRRDG